MAADPTPHLGFDPIALALDPNWQGLWDHPNSPLNQRITTLENLLHSTTHRDHEQTLGIKHELAAFRWLRDMVTQRANPTLDSPADPFGSQPRVRRILNLFHRPVNPSLG